MDKAGAMLRIVLIAMFFSVELSYVLAELERKGRRSFGRLLIWASFPVRSSAPDS